MKPKPDLYPLIVPDGFDPRDPRYRAGFDAALRGEVAASDDPTYLAGHRSGVAGAAEDAAMRACAGRF